MANDVWYGGDCETRIGLRANLATAPTSWLPVEFISLTVTPNQEYRPRTKLGNSAIRKNGLDPTRPRKAFFRLTSEVVLDADTRQLAIWLRAGMGAPVTTEVEEDELYRHVFESGAKSEHYFDLAVKVGENDIRVYEAMTLSQISTQFSGENTQDFNINIGLAGLRRKKLTNFPSGTVASLPDEAPVLRAQFAVNGTVADNMLSGSFSYGRGLQEGIFLSATPTVSSLRPSESQHSGSVTYRAVGAIYDQMEENEQSLSAEFRLLGVVEDHQILLRHPQALLAASPLPISGPGQIERTLTWSPYQTAEAAAAQIVIVNGTESYA